MLPRKKRLGRLRIEEILKKGKKIRTPAISISFLESANNLFTVIVPKKTASSSVKRHLLKRRFSYLIAKNPPKNKEIVFFLQKPMEYMTFAEMDVEYKKLISMLK